MQFRRAFQKGDSRTGRGFLLMVIAVRIFAMAPAVALAALASPAHAQSPVAIQGVEDDRVREAIEAILPERDAPETETRAERLAAEAADFVRQWLRSEGYYSGRAEPGLIAPLRPAVTVQLGARFTFKAPSIAYSGEPPDEETAGRVREAVSRLVTPGAPARAEAALAAEAAAVRTLRESGFAEAAAGDRVAVADHADGTLSLSLTLAPGASARLGDLVVSPDDAVRRRLIARLQTWEPGARYEPEIVTDTQRNFRRTGVFDSVQAELAPPGPDGLRDVVVTLDEAAPRSLMLGASYSTTEGVGLEADLALRNPTRRADTLDFGIVAAEFEQRLDVTWTLPHDLGPGRGRRYFAGLIRETVDPFDRLSASAGLAIEGERRFGFATAYGLTLAADFYDAAGGVENAYILSAFLDLRDDRTDNRLDARRGYILEARAEPAVSTGDASVPFVRSTAGARGFLSFGADDRFTTAGRLRLGWIQPIAGEAEDLPLERRFYAGGGGSVRGYAYRSIFPEQNVARAEPPGGQGLFEVSGELRGRFTERIGAAVFVDGGQAFDSFADAADLRWGAGVGARYDLGFAPLRVDVAFPLDRREQDEDFVFYVSLGQAF